MIKKSTFCHNNSHGVISDGINFLLEVRSRWEKKAIDQDLASRVPWFGCVWWMNLYGVFFFALVLDFFPSIWSIFSFSSGSWGKLDSPAGTREKILIAAQAQAETNKAKRSLHTEEEEEEMSTTTTTFNPFSVLNQQQQQLLKTLSTFSQLTQPKGMNNQNGTRFSFLVWLLEKKNLSI